MFWITSKMPTILPIFVSIFRIHSSRIQFSSSVEDLIYRVFRLEIDPQRWGKSFVRSVTILTPPLCCRVKLRHGYKYPRGIFYPTRLLIREHDLMTRGLSLMTQCCVLSANVAKMEKAIPIVPDRVIDRGSMLLWDTYDHSGGHSVVWSILARVEICFVRKNTHPLRLLITFYTCIFYPKNIPTRANRIVASHVFAFQFFFIKNEFSLIPVHPLLLLFFFFISLNKTADTFVEQLLVLY